METCLVVHDSEYHVNCKKAYMIRKLVSNNVEYSM